MVLKHEQQIKDIATHLLELKHMLAQFLESVKIEDEEKNGG